MVRCFSISNRQPSYFAVTFFWAIFGLVKKLKVYLSYFLLFVFAWVITPTHTIHSIFANHEDTADNFCATHHSHLGTHIEEQHTHCEFLKLNTPVYGLTEIVTIDCAINEVNTSPLHFVLSAKESSTEYQLPSRAPPIS